MTKFDYRAFAESMREQAQDLVPQEFSEEDNQYLVETLYNFALLAGEALVNNYHLNEEQAEILTQVVCEWTFHKSCDLIRSQVPKNCWDNILQKIAFTVFEVGRQAFERGISREDMLSAIGYHVNKCYKTTLDELLGKNAVSEEVVSEALTHSSIDEMAAEANKSCSDFDFKSFAEKLQEQAENLIPKEFSNENKKYLADTLYNFALMSGETLAKEGKLKENEAILLVQVIAEWTFHKTCDLIRSQIPKEHWDNILQHIAFKIFEVGKKAMKEDFEEKKLLNDVENQVLECYKTKLEELCESNAIAKEIMEEALTHSSIDEMAEENSKKTKKLKFDSQAYKNKEVSGETEKRQNFIIRHPWWCLFVIIPLIKFAIKILPRFIDLHSPILYLKAHILPISIGIIAFIIILRFMCKVVNADIENQQTELENVKKKMEDLVNPDRCYERLGSDVLCLFVGEGLLCIADPDQEGLLLPKTAAMRQRLTDTLGYIIPSVRIVDYTKLDYNEYTIPLRGTQVASGYVYPNKVMVKAVEWDATGKALPENATTGVTFNNEQCYWVDKSDAEGLNYMLPEDVIIKHEENICIQYVDKIMMNADVEKYLDTVKNPKLVETLLSRLDIEDIRDVFVNLIRERVSIKDTPYIVERLSYHARENKKPEYISEQLRLDLALQICSQNIDNDKVIYATKLSKEWIKILSDTELEEEGRSGSRLRFALDETQKENFIQEIGTQILKARQTTNKKVVLICPKDFRLVIYKMLSEPLPDIIVLAEEEIQSGFKVEET